MAHLQIDVPDEPLSDYITRAAIGTFYLAARSRRYISGMSVMPLPLGVREITDALEAHPVYIDRGVLDPCVFALDDAYLNNINESAEQSGDK